MNYKLEVVLSIIYRSVLEAKKIRLESIARHDLRIGF